MNKESFTTVTPFSKAVALIMVTLLPIASFAYGMYYQKKITERLIYNLEQENKNLYKALEIVSPPAKECEK